MIKKLFIGALALLSLASCSPKTIKVISYNIRLGVADDGENRWENRKPATLAMLTEQDPEIFGVQEAYDFQLSYITDNLPKYKCIGVGREDGADKGEHMSIFYDSERMELLDWGTYWLSETPDVPSKGWDAACIRTATWAYLKVKKTGKQLFYVNTHLDHVGKEARLNGLRLVIDKIGEMNPDGYPMILTGDFNVTPDDPCLVELAKLMESARLTAKDSDGNMDSFNGWGAPGHACPIDYIYYKGFKSCDTFKVLNKQYGDVPYISDHYPVASVLEF